MRALALRVSPLAVGALLAGSACGGGDPCPTGEGLRAQLAAMTSGQTLVVDDACTVHGAVAVPAGVTLRGGTYALGPDEQITLAPSPDASAPSTLDGVRVTGGAVRASILVSGTGHAQITHATLDVERGVGIGVAGATVLVDDVTLTGALDPAHVLDVPANPTPADRYALYGLAVHDGGEVTVRGSHLSRFADAGLACIDATLHLESTILTENRGIGVAAFGCTLDAADVEVSATLAAPGLPGMGFAIVDGSTLTMGARLSIHDAPGYGLYANASEVTLSSPTLTNMGQAGVWADGGAMLAVDGGTFDAGRGAGIAAIGVETVDVRATEVHGLASAPLPTAGGLGAETMADALHLVQVAGTPSRFTLSDLTLTDNARVGVVIDGGGAAVTLTVSGTRVETSGAELGAIAQHAPGLAAGWDSGVTRVGSAATLDVGAPPIAVSDGLGAQGILMPPTILF